MILSLSQPIMRIFKRSQVPKFTKLFPLFPLSKRTTYIYLNLSNLSTFSNIRSKRRATMVKAYVNLIKKKKKKKRRKISLICLEEIPVLRARKGWKATAGITHRIVSLDTCNRPTRRSKRTRACFVFYTRYFSCTLPAADR